MKKEELVVVVFGEDSDAIEGSHKLHELAAHGDVKLGNTVMIRKKEDSTFEYLKIEKNSSGQYMFKGFAIGILSTMLFGPFLFLIGMFTGTAIGAHKDKENSKIDENFVVEVKAKMGVGKIAIIANCKENSPMFIDDTMRAVNGDVYRSTYEA